MSQFFFLKKDEIRSQNRFRSVWNYKKVKQINTNSHPETVPSKSLKAARIKAESVAVTLSVQYLCAWTYCAVLSYEMLLNPQLKPCSFNAAIKQDVLFWTSHPKVRYITLFLENQHYPGNQQGFFSCWHSYVHWSQSRDEALDFYIGLIVFVLLCCQHVVQS